MWVFHGPLMCMRVAFLEIRHWQLLCSSEPKNKNLFFHNFFAKYVSWRSQESVEPMRVFNRPLMRMQVAIIEIQHQPLFYSSEQKLIFFNFFPEFISWHSQQSVLWTHAGFNRLLMCMRVTILEICHLQLLYSSELKMKINFFIIFLQNLFFEVLRSP